MALYGPPGVDADKIEANVKNGVLTGTLPKTAEETENHDQEGLICLRRARRQTRAGVHWSLRHMSRLD